MPFLKKRQILFCKNNTLILPKSSEKLISSIYKCTRVWLTTYLLCFMDVFFNTVVIHMGTNCTPLLTDLFLYSETDLIQGLLKKNEKKLAWHLNFMFRYIDDFISLNNSNFGDFSDHIYPSIPRIQLGMLHTSTNTLKLTLVAG
jgi:hypothetical protein